MTKIDGLVQYCNNLSVLVMELLRSGTKPSKSWQHHDVETLSALLALSRMGFDDFFVVSMKRLLNWLSSCWLYQISLCKCDISLMWFCILMDSYTPAHDFSTNLPLDMSLQIVWWLFGSSQDKWTSCHDYWCQFAMVLSICWHVLSLGDMWGSLYVLYSMLVPNCFLSFPIYQLKYFRVFALDLDNYFHGLMHDCSISIANAMGRYCSPALSHQYEWLRAIKQSWRIQINRTI